MSCPICLESLLEAHAVVPCAHEFCAACLSSWFKVGCTCPLCRGPIQALRSCSGQLLPAGPATLSSITSATPGSNRQAAMMRFINRRNLDLIPATKRSRQFASRTERSVVRRPQAPIWPKRSSHPSVAFLNVSWPASFATQRWLTGRTSLLAIWLRFVNLS